MLQVPDICNILSASSTPISKRALKKEFLLLVSAIALAASARRATVGLVDAQCRRFGLYDGPYRPQYRLSPPMHLMNGYDLVPAKGPGQSWANHRQHDARALQESACRSRTIRWPSSRAHPGVADTLSPQWTAKNLYRFLRKESRSKVSSLSR